MDHNSTSDDDDDIVIATRLPTERPNGWEHCSNNNNDVLLAQKDYFPDNFGPSKLLPVHKNDVSQICKVEQGRQAPHNELGVDLSGSVVEGHATTMQSCEGVTHESRHTSNDFDENAKHLNGENSPNERRVSNDSSSSRDSAPVKTVHPLRKNNTFPLYGEAEYDVDICMDGVLPKIPPHITKRLLPPINGVATKRNRLLSDTDVVMGTVLKSSLPKIEGSPLKKQNSVKNDNSDEDDSDDDEVVQFKLGDEELSDRDVDDSSSSDEEPPAPSSSSGDEKEAAPNEDSSVISDHLQTKFLKALRLEELRRSSTSSICSAPVFKGGKDTSSSSDEEDIKSTVSDSKVIRNHSAGKRKRLRSHRSGADPELIVRRCSSDFMAELEDEEPLTPRSTLGRELVDYEEDGLSETASTRSVGILPAIASHGIRERNFMVGNLTKHGSLLGADELNRYFPDRQLRLYVGTWNMQRKGIPRNLNDFLLPKHEEYLRDMYVIGVQEATQDQKKWEIKLQETLGPNHVLAHSVSHGVLHLSVFIRRDLIWFCSPFEEDRVTTRMVSQIKTKGAVAISFQFFGTSMIFVTSHFHSGETRIKERVEDYNRIKEKLKLPKQTMSNPHKGSPNDVSTRFDCTFWFGDLNFRVSQPHQLMHQEVKNPDSYDFKEVLKGDQLTATKRRGRIFCGFTEPKIKFLPTYKFNPGTDDYDTSPKLRVPSYTDRILYKTKENDMVTCTTYDSVTSLKKSDHRPVYALFEVSLKPGRDSIPFGGGRFRRDVYEKAARMRAQQGRYQNNSAVCTIL